MTERLTPLRNAVSFVYHDKPNVVTIATQCVIEVTIEAKPFR